MRVLWALSIVAALVAFGGCGGGAAEAFRIVSSSPTDGATGVSAQTTVVLNFSGPANPATLAFTFAPAVEAAASGNAAAPQLTLPPAQALAANTTYTVTLTALSSAEGVALSGDTTTAFTTEGGLPGSDYVVWRYTGGDAKPPTLAFSVPGEPAKSQAVTDPVYRTTVRRVTDKTTDGYSSDGIMNEYSRADPENCDATRVLLRGTDGQWELYGLPGFTRTGSISFRDNPDPEPRWHPTDPDVVFFVEGPSLWRMDVSTSQTTLVHDFSAEDPNCAFARTRYEGEPSADGRYWCVRLEDASYTLFAIVCNDATTNTILGRLDSPPADCDHVTMALGGTRCIVPSDAGAAYSYALDFTNPVRLPDGMGHADVARTLAGDDVLVYQNAQTDWIAMVDLATGIETNLVPIPFSDNLDIGLHISAGSAACPGWVLVSTYGANTTAQSWMDRSLFMLQLQANPLVWRIAQTQCLQASGDERDYFGEAYAALNGLGTRVWWGSNWNTIGAEGAGYEAYVAELPANWETEVLAAE